GARSSTISGATVARSVGSSTAMMGMRVTGDGATAAAARACASRAHSAAATSATRAATDWRSCRAGASEWYERAGDCEWYEGAGDECEWDGSRSSSTDIIDSSVGSVPEILDGRPTR